MPKTTGSGKPDPEELPSTLQRSPGKAQRTFAKAHDAAAEQYGEGRRAHQTAYAAVKQSFEKVGDHWEAKDEKGPSDAGRGGDTKGGVDAHSSKKHLYEFARRLDVPGRSGMTKEQLVEALDQANQRASATSRRQE